MIVISQSVLLLLLSIFLQHYIFVPSNRYIVKPSTSEKNGETDAGRQNSESVRTQIRVVMSIVVFDEFVKELAAISQEHSLQQLLDEVPTE